MESCIGQGGEQGQERRLVGKIPVPDADLVPGPRKTRPVNTARAAFDQGLDQSKPGGLIASSGDLVPGVEQQQEEPPDENEEPFHRPNHGSVCIYIFFHTRTV